MGYVQVPVPEEHVQEVMQFIIRTVAQAAIDPWDEEAVMRLFEEVDEASRSLLAFVARATLEGVDLKDVDAAKKLQLTPRETAGIMNELNNTTREANRPSLVTSRTVSERLPNGRTTDRRVLQMEQEVAALVRAAERAELANTPDPLGDSGQ